MNLADMADFVCAKARKKDSDSIAACKDYIKRRDEMLWDEFLWRDSLYSFEKALTPTTDTLQAAGIVMLPKVIDRVVAARVTDHPLNPSALEWFYQQTPDEFDETGDPVDFVPLFPVVHESPTAVVFSIKSSQANDGQAVVKWIDANHNQRTNTVALMDAPQLVGAYVIQGQPLPVPIPAATGFVIEDVVKGVTSGTVTVAADGKDIFTLSPSDTKTTPQQRIQLFPAPNQAVTMRFLVKRIYVEISHDNEEPRLRNATNALLAYAMGDMLERSKQSGQAQAKFAEAMALLAKMENIEYFQQAGRQRLVPVVEPYGVESGGVLPGKDYLW